MSRPAEAKQKVQVAEYAGLVQESNLCSLEYGWGDAGRPDWTQILAGADTTHTARLIITMAGGYLCPRHIYLLFLTTLDLTQLRHCILTIDQCTHSAGQPYTCKQLMQPHTQLAWC